MSTGLSDSMKPRGLASLSCHSRWTVSGTMCPASDMSTYIGTSKLAWQKRAQAKRANVHDDSVDLYHRLRTRRNKLARASFCSVMLTCCCSTGRAEDVMGNDGRRCVGWADRLVFRRQYELDVAMCQRQRLGRRVPVVG